MQFPPRVLPLPPPFSPSQPLSFSGAATFSGTEFPSVFHVDREQSGPGILRIPQVTPGSYRTVTHPSTKFTISDRDASVETNFADFGRARVRRENRAGRWENRLTRRRSQDFSFLRADLMAGEVKAPTTRTQMSWTFFMVLVFKYAGKETCGRTVRLRIDLTRERSR